MPCTAVLSGVERIFAVADWTSVSRPAGIPAKAAIADIFDPRSKPDNFALLTAIVPAVTSLSAGPANDNFVLRIPALSEEPAGNAIPRAGSVACSSGREMLDPVRVIFRTSDPPCSA